MASYNVVEDNLEFLQKIVKEYVDIVFANEEEAKAFTGKSPEEAVHEFGKLCEYAIVKNRERRVIGQTSWQPYKNQSH
ncbi:MAG: hypothetical protein R2750_14270 [Bacteroidales bacterium]